MLLLTLIVALAVSRIKAKRVRFFSNLVGFKKVEDGDRFRPLVFEVDDSHLNNDYLSVELKNNGSWKEANSETTRLSPEVSNTTGHQSSMRHTFNFHNSGDHFYDFTMSYGDCYIIFLEDKELHDLHGPYVVPRKIKSLHRIISSPKQQHSLYAVAIPNEIIVTITRGPAKSPHQPDTDRFFVFTFPEPLPEDGLLHSRFQELYSGKWESINPSNQLKKPTAMFDVTGKWESNNPSNRLKKPTAMFDVTGERSSNGKFPTIRHGSLVIYNFKEREMPDFVKFAIEKSVPPRAAMLMCLSLEIRSERSGSGAEFRCERYLNVSYMMRMAAGNAIWKPRLRDIYMRYAMFRTGDIDFYERALRLSKRPVEEQGSRRVMDLSHHGQLDVLTGNMCQMIVELMSTTSDSAVDDVTLEDLTALQDRIQLLSNEIMQRQQSVRVPIPNSAESKRKHPPPTNDSDGRVKTKRSRKL